MEEKSIIRNLLFTTNAFDKVEFSKTYKVLLDKLIESKENILNAIRKNEQLVKKFENFQKTMDDMLFEENATYYEEGFRLGVLLGLDVARLIKQE